MTWKTFCCKANATFHQLQLLTSKTKARKDGGNSQSPLYLPSDEILGQAYSQVGRV